MKQEVMIIVLRMGQGQYTEGIEAFCSKCNEKVYLADSSMKGAREIFPDIDFEKEPVALKCLECMIAEMEESGTLPAFLPPSPAQIKDIKKHIKRKDSEE